MSIILPAPFSAPAFRGALGIYPFSKGMGSGAASWYLEHHTHVYDTDSILTGTTTWEVPTGVSKIIMSGGCYWGNGGTGYRGIHLDKVGVGLGVITGTAGNVGCKSDPNGDNTAVYGNGHYQNFISPVLDVSGGDEFRMYCEHDSVVAQGPNGAWLAMEIVE